MRLYLENTSELPVIPGWPSNPTRRSLTETLLAAREASDVPSNRNLPKPGPEPGYRSVDALPAVVRRRPDGLAHGSRPRAARR
jgi:hypothetical protein